MVDVPPSETGPGQFVNPFDSYELLDYFAKLNEWHDYIRFLGLSAIWDTPDLPLDKLFVMPRLSGKQIAPFADEEEVETGVELYEYLRNRRRLVILGDPGTGKSTIVSWLTHRLTLRNTGGLEEAIGRLIPLPLVLRELELGAVKTWDDLLTAFLAHQVAAPLKRETVERLLTSGQGLVLLDGIDEIASIEIRKALRAAYAEGVQKYPLARWVMTSRIVGYDEVPFQYEFGANNESIFQPTELVQWAGRLKRSGAQGMRVERRIPEQAFLSKFREGSIDADIASSISSLHYFDGISEIEFQLPAAEVGYICPFNRDQIHRFACNWYAVRDSRDASNSVGGVDFMESISKSREVFALARVPNLLTMMVLVHRTQARLPDGKVELLKAITQAYLGGIDAFRKLDTIEQFKFEEKLQWLARIGYECQVRKDEGSSTVLVEKSDLIGWLMDEIGKRHRDQAEEIATRFLEFVARRSGLLVPRSETKYSFVHLSFQEFLAASYLGELFRSKRWMKGQLAEPSREQVGNWVLQPGWQETIRYLFEMLSLHHEAALDVIPLIFAEKALSSENESIGHMAIDLASRPTCLFTQEERAELFRVAWQINGNVRLEDEVSELAIKLSDRFAELEVLSGLQSALTVHPALVVRAQLDNTRFAQLLASNLAIKKLVLRRSRIDSIEGIGTLAGLTLLNLGGTSVSDLAPLSDLTSLTALWLDSTQVSDLSPLSGLTSLTTLVLNRTQVSDVPPLSGLTSLTGLWLNSTLVSDLSPLSGLCSLATLALENTEVSDVSALCGLTSLTTLSLDNSTVSDLSPLSGSTSLTELSLDNTQVSDLSALSACVSIKSLWFNNTEVLDLTPLSGLTSLRLLSLDATPVSDLYPLSGLTSLRVLSLDMTPVSDLSPLLGLNHLKTIWMYNTRVKEIPVALSERPNLNIYGHKS